MADLSTLPDAILAEYNLGRIHAVGPKSGGWIDRSFIVSGEQGRYFFKRRSPAYTRDMVACDHALIQFLVSQTFPTPALVPTRSGDTWVEWEECIYEAYTYVEGTGFSPGDPRQMASLGRTVGQYHRLVAGYRPPRPKLPPWLMLACRIVDALWVDEFLPIDYRRELHLAQELCMWLMQNAASLQDDFS